MSLTAAAGVVPGLARRTCRPTCRGRGRRRMGAEAAAAACGSAAAAPSARTTASTSSAGAASRAGVPRVRAGADWKRLEGRTLTSTLPTVAVGAGPSIAVVGCTRHRGGGGASEHRVRPAAARRQREDPVHRAPPLGVLRRRDDQVDPLRGGRPRADHRAQGLVAAGRELGLVAAARLPRPRRAHRLGLPLLEDERLRAHQPQGHRVDRRAQQARRRLVAREAHRHRAQAVDPRPRARTTATSSCSRRPPAPASTT